MVTIQEALHREMMAALRERRPVRPREEVLAGYPLDEVEEHRRAEEIRQAEFEAELDRERERKRRQELEAALGKVGLPLRFRRRFSDLERSDESAMRDCQAYVDGGLMLRGRPGLLLVGPSGTGKSTLAGATLVEAVHAGCRSARYVSLSHLLQAARRSYAGEEGRDDEVLAISERKLIALDDLGRQRLTPWAAEALYILIDAIYAEERHLVATTNLSQEQWCGGIDEAVRSRIEEMCVPVTMSGVNMRCQRKEDRDER